MRLGSFFLFSWENADNGAHITGMKKNGEKRGGGYNGRGRALAHRERDRQTDRQTET